MTSEDRSSPHVRNFSVAEGEVQRNPTGSTGDNSPRLLIRSDTLWTQKKHLRAESRVHTRSINALAL